MAFVISEECINCAACEPECPQSAVHSHQENFAISHVQPLSIEHYFIFPDECNECEDLKSIPSCVEICPMNCITK